MTFNSVPYLCFLGLAVVLFWVLPVRLRRASVLLASLGFYASWGLLFVWLPLLVAGIVYLIGRRITAEPSHQKKWVWLGIMALLTLLIVFKYHGFLLSILHVL